MPQVKKIKCSSEEATLISACDLGIATAADLERLRQLSQQSTAAAQWEECTEEEAEFYQQVGFEVRR